MCEFAVHKREQHTQSLRFRVPPGYQQGTLLNGTQRLRPNAAVQVQGYLSREIKSRIFGHSIYCSRKLDSVSNAKIAHLEHLTIEFYTVTFVANLGIHN